MVRLRKGLGYVWALSFLVFVFQEQGSEVRAAEMAAIGIDFVHTIRGDDFKLKLTSYWPVNLSLSQVRDFLIDGELAEKASDIVDRIDRQTLAPGKVKIVSYATKYTIEINTAYLCDETNQPTRWEQDCTLDPDFGANTTWFQNLNAKSSIFCTQVSGAPVVCEFQVEATPKMAGVWPFRLSPQEVASAATVEAVRVLGTTLLYANKPGSKIHDAVEEYEDSDLEETMERLEEDSDDLSDPSDLKGKKLTISGSSRDGSYKADTTY